MPPYTGAATLVIGISRACAPGTSFGQLKVTGTATWAGTLVIQTSRAYLPPVGTTISVLTSGVRIGTFSTITGSQLAGEHWAATYTATGVTLTATIG